MPLPSGSRPQIEVIVQISVPNSTVPGLFFGSTSPHSQPGFGYEKAATAEGSVLTPSGISGPLFDFSAIPDSDTGFLPPFGTATGIIECQFAASITLPSGRVTATLKAPATSATVTFLIDTVYEADLTEAALGGAFGSVYVYREILKSGGGCSVSIQTPAGSASQSGTISSSDASGVNLDNAYTGQIQAGSFGVYDQITRTAVFSSAVCTATLNGQPLAVNKSGTWAIPPPFGNPALLLSVDFSGGVNVSNQLGGVDLEMAPFVYYGGQLEGQFPTSFGIGGETFALDQPYPGTLNYWAVMQTGFPDGNFGGGGWPRVNLGSSPTGIPQFPWQCNASLYSDARPNGGTLNTQVIVVNNPHYLRGLSVYVDLPSLTANGDGIGRPAFSFMEMPAKPFNAISAAVATDAIWDDLSEPRRWYPGGGAASPAGYPNTTLFSGNEIQFDTSQDSFGNPPTQMWVRGIYPSPVVNSFDVKTPLLGYRYLQFDIQSVNVGFRAFTVQISDSLVPGITPLPDKFWDVLTSGAGSSITVRLDLCAPNSGGPTNSDAIQQDTQFPAFYGFNEWGIALLQQLRFNFPAGSEQYIISNLKLKRVNDPRWTFLVEPTKVIDGSATIPITYPPRSYTPWRGATIDVDGRRVELANAFPDPLLSGGPRGLGLADTVSAINAMVGWTATNLATVPAWNVSQLAAGLGGNGAINVAGGQSWYDNPHPSGTIQSQVRVATLFCPPQCGDILGTGGGSGDVSVPVRLRLRGAFTGLTLDNTGQPVPSNGVTVMQGINPRGTATSDSEARYLTGMTYPVPGIPCVVDAAGLASVTLGAADRAIRRACPLAKPVPERYPWLHNTVDGRCYLATVNQKGDVRVRWSPHYLPKAGAWEIQTDVTTTHDCQFPTICEAINSFQRAYLIYERATYSGTTLTACDLWQSWTDDFGETWEPPTLFQSGARRGMTATNAEGDLAQAWFVYNSGTSGPGKIHVQHKGRAQTSWSAAVVAKDQTGADIVVIDGGFVNIVGGVSSLEPWIMAVILNGGSQPTNYMCTDAYGTPGLTWKQV